MALGDNKAGENRVVQLSDGTWANRVLLVGTSGLTSGQTTAALSMPVTLPSDGPKEIIGTVNAAGFLTRLGNTTAYTAGDEVSDVASSSAHPFVFSEAGRAAGGAGWITKVRLQSSDPLNVSAVYRLYLFDTAPTMVGDNLAYALLGAEFGVREGFIDIGPMVTSVGAGVASIHQDTRLRYVCAAAGTSLYGILVVQAAYTPLNAGTFYVELTCDRDS